VRGEDDDAVLADLAEQVEEAHALGGVEPAVGSSTMMSDGSPRSATAIPKRWRMPPE
jgi:hypothetical protein